jgi:phage-related protein
MFEEVRNYRVDTNGVVYTVKLEGAVYVLHALQKKSPSGIRVPRPDVELIARRLCLASQDYEGQYGTEKKHI